MTTIFHGIPQTKAALALAEKQIELAAPSAARAGAEAVARAAASRAPRRTGTLASSIRVTESSSLGEGATASAGTAVGYARFPEFGTVHMQGTHFMEQGAESAQNEIIAKMISIFRTAIT